MKDNLHIPVMLHECLDALNIKPDGIYADLTTGEAGHSYRIAQRLDENGRLICFDRDSEIQAIAKKNLSEFSQISFVLDTFANLEENLVKAGAPKIDGILADLGLSMFHYKASEKGFSFLREDPLDMSLDGQHPNLNDIVNSFAEDEISDIIFKYGEERASRKIANYIVRYRQTKKFENTAELAELIKKVFPPQRRKSGFHPATKSFQAFRIFINKELEFLETMMEQALRVLNPGGRLAIITYHSIEDRIVKWYFKNKAQEKALKILTKKPIISSEEEVQANPSARSAKLRVAEII